MNGHPSGSGMMNDGVKIVGVEKAPKSPKKSRTFESFVARLVEDLALKMRSSENSGSTPSSPQRPGYKVGSLFERGKGS